LLRGAPRFTLPAGDLLDVNGHRRCQVRKRALSLRFGLIGLLVLACMPYPASGQERPADILFSRPHLSNLPAGTELIYELERKSSDPARLGPSFNDEIALVITAAARNGGRDVDLRVFTGERERKIDSITEMTGNPLLVFFLDRAVSDMARLTGGTAPYLKDRLRAGLRDKAVSEPVKVAFEGKTLDATRITVRPFENDMNTARMLGFEGSRFEFVLAEAAPGMLLEMSSHFSSTMPDAPKLEERIVLKSAKASP